MRITLTILVMLLIAAPAIAAEHYEVDLSWTQPDPQTQSGYRLEVRLGLTGPYGPLGSPLPSTARSFRDPGPYTPGQVVCHKVIATSAAGEVPFDEQCSNAPVVLPGKGVLQQQWILVP